MNKWSTSLPSIISLSSDVQFDFEPTFLHPTSTSSPSSSSTATAIHRNHRTCTGSVTDLSISIQTQPTSYPNYDSYSIPYETSNFTSHEQFIPNDQLLQSLVAYADSFDLDTTVYSVQNSPQPTTAVSGSQSNSPRRRSQSTTTHLTSMMDNESLGRHKSCDDLSIAGSLTNSSKQTTVIHQNNQSTKFRPSETHPEFFFTAKNESRPSFDRHREEKLTDDRKSATAGSKIEWTFASDTMNELFHNYEATTNIGNLNSHYLQDLDRISSIAATMDFPPENSSGVPTPPPPPPVIIRKKSKDLVLKQKVDIQLLRPPTPPPPAPIIIREIRPKPAAAPLRPVTYHHKLENTGHIHLSKTPPLIVLRERPPPRPSRHLSSQPTIVYRQLPTPPPLTPPPPTVIMERLRSNAPAKIQKPAPILIEKWLPYPPEQKRQIIYERASPLPMKKKSNEQAQHIILEYDDINVIVDKDIQQRKEIKRVRPEEYLKQYGNSLYSNETFSDILTNVTCASQVRNEQNFFNNSMLSHQHHLETSPAIFH